MITQTCLTSQLTQICNKWQIWAIELYSNKWIKLEANLFEYYHKTYIHSIHLLNVILWSYPFKLTQCWSLSIKFIQIYHSKQHMYISNSINSYSPNWYWSTHCRTLIAHDKSSYQDPPKNIRSRPSAVHGWTVRNLI